MPHFRYVAASRDGQIEKGVIEAQAKVEVVQVVQQRGLILMEVAPAEAPVKKTRVPVSRPAPPVETVAAPGSVRWNRFERAVYIRHLQTMFEAGVSLSDTLHTLAETGESRPEVQRRLQQVAAEVTGGQTLSKAMARSGLFTALQVGTVQAGENGGGLGSLLRRLADVEEKEVEVQRRLLSSISYPAVVLVLMVCALAILGNVMSRVLQSMPGVEPPGGLLGLVYRLVGSPFLFLLLLLGPVAAVLLVGYLWEQTEPRRYMESWISRLPKFGHMTRRLEAARICRLLAVLSSSGLRFDRSLELVAKTSTSPMARDALRQAAGSLRDGMTVSQCLASTRYFPNDVLQMTNAGEESGQLPQMLAKVADYAETEVEHFLESLIAMIEPLLMAFLGIAVGVIILLTFAPVYRSLQHLA